MSAAPVRELIARWRDDPGGTYQTWFLWDERLKNFRSIRRGIEKVVAEIEAGTFGNVYKGSSLEAAVGAIAEQRQIFKGADHAFLWKPKLRIPDIYEDRENQLAFGRFLGTCLCCGGEEALVAEIRRASHMSRHAFLEDVSKGKRLPRQQPLPEMQRAAAPKAGASSAASNPSPSSGSSST